MEKYPSQTAKSNNETIPRNAAVKEDPVKEWSGASHLKTPWKPQEHIINQESQVKGIRNTQGIYLDSLSQALCDC